ncbi:MAG: DUF5676 family membrane protein [archaeon]|nr:DUF5676 family membrane protein [archaeon]
MDGLNVKAAAIAGAVTGAVLHLLAGIVFAASPGMMSGMYSMMMYNSLQYGMGAFSITSLIGSIVLGAIVGAIVGWLIAVSYNWGLKK